MAHVRRKFVDVHKAQGSAIADEAIVRIAELYAVEKAARGLPPDKPAAIRQVEAKPAFESLEAWLNTQLPNISGKSPLASAIRYALTRMARMRPCLDHGILEIDNTTAERAMRAVALGPQKLPLRWIANRRQIRRYRLHPDRNRKTQWRRSPSLARRHPRPHPGPQDQPDR
jgi:hypothetical protein